MNEALFRKVSIQRISSPEQLDQLLHVTRSQNWLLIVALLLVVSTAVVWGYTGTVITTVAGQAVIVREGGVFNVVAQGGGIVASVPVRPREHLQPNQVIAVIAQPELIAKLNASKKALDEATAERTHAQQIATNTAMLQLTAIDHQKTNADRQIQQLIEMEQIDRQQVVLAEQLLSKGLVTKQRVLDLQQKEATAQNTVEDLRAQIKQLEAQEFAVRSQPSRDDAALIDRIENLERDVADCERELRTAENARTPYGGEVLDLQVYPGSSVSVGQPIISVQPDHEKFLLVAYVSSLHAKDIKIGMAVQVSPSNIEREEFGFMLGNVVYVADYPATIAALMRNFENEPLAKALSASGPVTEIQVELMRDSGTISGFKWSSSQGPPIALSPGTLCTAQVITRRQKPVSLVFPYIDRAVPGH